MDKPILKITYDAHASNYTIEDFMHIEDFKADLETEYTSFIKPNPVGRGGGAYDLVVEFLLNTDLKTYLKIIGSYLAGKTADKLIEPKLNQYLFKPFFSFFKSFSEKHGGIEICEFDIELYDSKIIIHKIEGISIDEIFERILDAIYKSFDKLVIEDEFPSEFTIPVFTDFINEKIIYRPPLGMGERKENIVEQDYFSLWKLEYRFLHGQKVYDLVNERFLEDAEFVTESEFYNRLSAE